MSGFAASTYGPIFEACAAMSFAVAVVAWRRRPADGALGLVVWSAANGVWAAAIAAQLMLTDRSPSLFWLLIRLNGTAGATIGILFLVIEHIGRRWMLSRRTMAVIIALPVVTLGVVMTEPLHGLYLAGAEPAMRVVRGGPWFMVNAVYLWALLFISILLLLIDLVSKRGVYRLQSTILLAAIAIPGIVMGTEMGGYSSMPGVNATPVAFGFSCALVAFGLFRLGLFDIVPVARDSVIESMPIGMAVFDPQGRLADINPAALGLLSLGHGAVGRSSQSVFANSGPVAPQLQSLIDAGAGTSEFELNGDPGAPCTIEASASEVLDSQGRRAATILLLTDVSERVTEERRRREFVANASHELQTPLADLSLLGSTIEHVARSDSEQLEPFLQMLRREIERLVQMTKGLLILSRLDDQADVARSTRQPVDLAVLVRAEVAEVASLAADKGLSVDVDVCADAVVNGEAAGLGMLIGNLLENAVRYTERGGRIEVSLSREQDDMAASEQLVIRVHDTGMGIAPDDQAHIFERFFRVDKARSRETGGTGLGLSIVRTIAEQHNGSVSVTSQLGHGSTFTVRLPVSPPT